MRAWSTSARTDPQTGCPMGFSPAGVTRTSNQSPTVARVDAPMAMRRRWSVPLESPQAGRRRWPRPPPRSAPPTWRRRPRHCPPPDCGPGPPGRGRRTPGHRRADRPRHEEPSVDVELLAGRRGDHAAPRSGNQQQTRPWHHGRRGTSASPAEATGPDRGRGAGRVRVVASRA